MSERRATIASAVGLHARPAALFSQAAAACGVPVTITGPNGRTVNAASILGVMSLGADFGQEVVLAADGPGADEALDTLAAMLERDLELE